MEILGYKTDILTVVLLGIETLTFLILILYYTLVQLRVSLHKEKKRAENICEPVSVIVCAKNDYLTLKEKLFYLMEQEYPAYEVVVVNHASQDETQFLLQVFSETYPHLKTVNIREDINHFKGNKFPIAIGIKSAQYEQILLTEPDCMPNSYKWIESMQSHFTEKTQIILGFSMYETRNTFLNKLLQYDTLKSTASCFAFTLMGRSYAGFGKNIGYRKTFFFEQNGFIKHYHVPEGADCLFVNQNATVSNVNIAVEKDSFVTATPKTQWKDWFAEKRYFFICKRYFKTSDRVLLNFYPLSLFLFYAAFAGLLLCNFPWQVLIPVIFVKFAWQMFCFYKLMIKFYGKRKMFIFAPLFELLFLFVDGIIDTVSILNKTRRNRWK